MQRTNKLSYSHTMSNENELSTTTHKKTNKSEKHNVKPNKSDLKNVYCMIPFMGYSKMQDFAARNQDSSYLWVVGDN